MKTTYVTTTEAIEELGRKKESSIEVEIEWELTPGEPMVMYYPDGSGYPGSPPMAEAQSVKILSACCGDQDIVKRDWLQVFELYVWQRLETDLHYQWSDSALVVAEERV